MRKNYGATANDVVGRLIDKARTDREAWHRWDDLGLRASYQSIGNSLRHAWQQGRVERKPDPGRHKTSLWRFNCDRMEGRRRLSGDQA